MWLIIAALAAVITTAIWYVQAPEDKYKLSLLSWIFWGATLMWFVDYLMAYLAEGGEFFKTGLELGLVIIFALLVIVLLVSDPKGVLKRVLRSNNNRKLPRKIDTGL